MTSIGIRILNTLWNKHIHHCVINLSLSFSLSFSLSLSLSLSPYYCSPVGSGSIVKVLELFIYNSCSVTTVLKTYERCLKQLVKGVLFAHLLSVFWHSRIFATLNLVQTANLSHLAHPLSLLSLFCLFSLLLFSPLLYIVKKIFDKNANLFSKTTQDDQFRTI